MRLQVSTSACLVVLAALVLCAGIRAQAQSTAARTAGNGTYIAIDPLAGVRYDNRFDLSLGAAYGHQKAGPPPLEQGSNLGGLDLTGSVWFTRNLAWKAPGAPISAPAAHWLNPYLHQGTVCQPVHVCRRPGVAGTA